MRWRTKTYRQRSIDNFLNKIEKIFCKKGQTRDDLIIILGDWNGKTANKGCQPTLGKGWRKIISKRFVVYLLDEHNTSQKCSKCFERIENVKIEGVEMHQLIMCRNCCTMKLDRLENGVYMQQIFET